MQAGFPFVMLVVLELTLNGLEISVSFVLLIFNLNSQLTIKNQIASCPLFRALQDSHLLQYAINFGVSIIALNNTSVKFVWYQPRAICRSLIELNITIKFSPVACFLF